MSQRITTEQKKRLTRLQSEFGVRIERSMNGFKVLGLCNGTEPRSETLDSTISLAESITQKMYRKYL